MFKLRLAVLVAFLVLGSFDAYSSDQPEVPTFRSNSRLIVVDVVVTGKHDEPITDLAAGDFTVFEDGKPQRLASFEKHFVKSGLAPNAAPKLAPNQYTNALDVAPDTPLNILLIDAVNSSWLNQAETRRAIVHFLTTLPPSQPIALFVLGDRLRMVQGFTTNSDLLIKAALTYKPETSLAQSGVSSIESVSHAIEEMQSRGFSVDGLQQILDNETALNMRDRFQETVSAFKQISRAVGGYSGRKNLVWLSAAFPLDLRPLAAEQMGINRNERFEVEMKEVAHLMTTSKIAVYPVDIRGLNSGNSLLSENVAAMRVIANDTGGRAFFNRNDIDMAMSKAVELGSSYYTVSYSPKNSKWNGNFRDIRIEVNRKDANLSYRRGYYAVDTLTAPKGNQLERDVQLAMIGESPASTGIILRASIVERKQDGTTVVEYGLAGNQLHLRDADNKPFAAKYAFGVMGWDRKGKVVGMGSQVWDLPGDAAIVAKIEREGWTHHLAAKIPADAVRLRVAVQDQSTGSIGTVDIPLAGKQGL